MSFGQNYINRFMFDYDEGWDAGGVADWAGEQGFRLSSALTNTLGFNRQRNSKPVLMLYTPLGERSQIRLSGYFVLRNEANETYIPEGWEFISAIPEEILI